jgi:2-desacetyl-2-hydroxyethyl bacteriochlorophyllide A dehydrogenase
MRAFVVTAPHEGSVLDVTAPRAEPGDVVVDVRRVGVCGTDVEFFTGEMAYLHEGRASYPLRLGHEWCGVVCAVGRAEDEHWLGRRVTADTMIGCGHCRRCRSGRHNVCADRFEIGIRGGFPGALAEQLAVPVSALLVLPDSVDDTAGAMVEPGGNATRAVQAAGVGASERLLVLGTGTIGLLAAELAQADGAEVHVAGLDPSTMGLARTRGFAGVWPVEDLPSLTWDGVIDASNGAGAPARAVDLVSPGGRLVFIGLSGAPSLIDTRTLVLKDAVATGILAGSQGLASAIERYAEGAVDPHALVSATVGLDLVGPVLAGWRPPDAGPGPKVHVDPQL